MELSFSLALACYSFSSSWHCFTTADTKPFNLYTLSFKKFWL